MVKAGRKLKLAEYALRAGDYDSAVGDTYRCIELCMRASLLNRDTRDPEDPWWVATYPCDSYTACYPSRRPIQTLAFT
jgi:hypothetical protein